MGSDIEAVVFYVVWTNSDDCIGSGRHALYAVIGEVQPGTLL